MSVSAQDLHTARRPEHLDFPVTEDQSLVIRKAAELLGWTVPEYVLCAVLDRAERDLYERAALDEWGPPFPPADSPEPVTSLMEVFGSA